VFDFNCNIGEGERSKELETAQYMSSVNVAAGLFFGNIMGVKESLEYASEHELAIGVLLGCPPECDLNAAILYQISAIDGFAKTYGLDLEHVRCEDAMFKRLNEDIEFAKVVAQAVKKYSPWLTLVIGNYELKTIIEKEIRINCAYEVTFSSASSIREIREMTNTPEMIHFTSAEDAKRAWDVLKPAPVGFNRVKAEIH